jgi:hypothetical protein
MKKIILSLLFTLFCTQNVFAIIGEYNPPELLARSDIQDGYNLPAMSFLNNPTPVINNNGDVLFKVMSVEGTNNQGIWLKTIDDQNGKIVYIAPEERFITDPSINDAGKIVFNLYDEGVTDGIFEMDSKSLEVDQVLRPTNLPIQHYTYPQILNNDHIIFRATNDLNDRMIYDLNATKLKKLLSEGSDVFKNKISYLFRPSTNENGNLVLKVRFGDRGQWNEENPDAILMVTPSLDPKIPGPIYKIIASDKDFDLSSDYQSFGNSVSLSHSGNIAFTATKSDSKKSILFFKDNVIRSYASEGNDDIGEIELFAPKVNDLGQVLFRAKDESGARAIFLADGTAVKKIIREGDVVNTDQGLAKVLDNPNFPGFGGEVDLNDKGDILIMAVLIGAFDNKELGSAIYKISPKN